MNQTQRRGGNGRCRRSNKPCSQAGRAAAWIGLLLIPALMAADDPGRPPTGAAAGSAKAAPSGAEFLEKTWPGHPEWLAMLADIVVKGEKIGGGDGWFRKAVAQTRFDWQSTRAALDRDGDGSISRPEFAGDARDFARLDRVRDGVLTAADFDFSPRSGAPAPGSVLFQRADRDGNGKITREEFAALFGTVDSGELGFLSLDDLQQVFAAPAETMRDRTGGQGGLTRGTFLKSFFRRELGAFPAGPGLDQAAPDFTLRTVDGGDEVTLSRRIGPKPVVLIFGNFTCSPFRAQAGNIEKLHRRYQDRATFLMVYVREAHPTDGWRMVANDRVGVATRQPVSDAERVEVARSCSKALGFGFPMLVDGIDDAVNDRYSGIPSRFYVIDRAGKIAYKSGRGPFGFKPEEMEQSLILLLRQEAGMPTPETSGRPARAGEAAPH